MKSLLIGLDGATFSVLDPLMAAGVMPFLKALVERGTRAELRSTPNPLTPPAWATVMTGRSPGNHGVFDFVRAEETADGMFVKLVDSRDLRCETIWSIAARHGQRVTALNFPLMFPPTDLDIFQIPGFVSWRLLRRAMSPSSLFERLQTLPGFNPRQVAWDIDLEQKCIQTFARDEYVEWLHFHLARERQWLDITRFLMQHEPCDLTAYLADGPDKLQHLAWRFLDPTLFPGEPSDWEREIRNLCLEYFRQLDGSIAELVAAAGPSARTFLVSDHGFGPSHEVVYLNVWLQRQGLLAWGEGGAYLDDSDEITARQMKTRLLDWERTTAYALTPSSNGIFIRVADEPGRPGVRPEQYETFRRELMADLLDFRDPRSGERVISRVMTREDAFPGQHSRLAPDLTLVLRDQGFVSVLNADATVKARKEPRGMHRLEGIFLAAGPGIRSTNQIAPLSILDVAPTLLYSLGLPIPADFEGRLPEEVFEVAALSDSPPRLQSSAAHAPAPLTNGAYSPAEEEDVMLRLKALGYIE